MEPEYDLLDTLIEEVDLGALLQRINDRLEYLIDRDHRIGHAYLLKIRTLEELNQAFEHQIIPLIQSIFRRPVACCRCAADQWRGTTLHPTRRAGLSRPLSGVSTRIRR